MKERARKLRVKSLKSARDTAKDGSPAIVPIVEPSKQPRTQNHGDPLGSRSRLPSRNSASISRKEPARVHDHSDHRIRPGSLQQTQRQRRLLHRRTLELLFYCEIVHSSGRSSRINSKRYDIDAKLEGSQVEPLQNLSPEQRISQIRLRVQSLLAERFRVQVRDQAKEFTEN